MPTLNLKQVSETSMQLVTPESTIRIDRPIDKGGGGTGLMGGQHLLMGIAGCFCSNLFAAAQARDITITELEIEVNASISSDPPKRFDSINLEVTHHLCSHPNTWSTLLSIARNGCISLNTMKSGVAVELNS